MKIQLPLGVAVSAAPQRVDQGLKILLSSPLCISQSANIPTCFYAQPHPLLCKSADCRNLAVVSIETFLRFHFAFAPIQMCFESSRRVNPLCLDRGLP